MPRTVMTDATSLRPVPPADREITAVGIPLPAGSPGSPNVSAHQNLEQIPRGLGTREQIQAELDDIAEAVRAFYLKQPDQVMRECAAYTARLTELCVLLHRVESLDRQYTKVRTQQVERWLAELERQFKYASRIVEIMRQDLALSGAAT